MKFLILAPFLLAPVFSQLGIVSDVANTIKATAEEGVKTVESAAVDGSHQVENIGKDVVQTAEIALHEIETVGTDLTKSIEGVFNPQQPQHGQPQQKKEEPISQSDISEEKESNTQNRRGPHQIDGQRRPDHKNRREGKDHYGKGEFGNGQKHHQKSERKFDAETFEQVKKIRQEMKKEFEEFKALKEEAQKQGKELSQETIKKHRETIRDLHLQIKELKQASRQKQNENDGENEETTEQSFTKGEWIHKGNRGSEEDREKMKEEIRKRIEEKMEEKLGQNKPHGEMRERQPREQTRQRGPEQKSRQQMGQMGGQSSQNGPSERRGPRSQNSQQERRGEQVHERRQNNNKGHGKNIDLQNEEQTQRREHKKGEKPENREWKKDDQKEERRQHGKGNKMERSQKQGRKHDQKEGKREERVDQQGKNHHKGKPRNTQDDPDRDQKTKNIRHQEPKEEQADNIVIDMDSFDDSLDNSFDDSFEKEENDEMPLFAFDMMGEQNDNQKQENDIGFEEERHDPQERLILFN